MREEKWGVARVTLPYKTPNWLALPNLLPFSVQNAERVELQNADSDPCRIPTKNKQTNIGVFHGGKKGNGHDKSLRGHGAWPKSATRINRQSPIVSRPQHHQARVQDLTLHCLQPCKLERATMAPATETEVSRPPQCHELPVSSDHTSANASVNEKANPATEEAANTPEDFTKGRPWRFWAIFPSLMLTTLLSAAEATGAYSQGNPTEICSAG